MTHFTEGCGCATRQSCFEPTSGWQQRRAARMIRAPFVDNRTPRGRELSDVGRFCACGRRLTAVLE
jgi:hypothetical protein